MAQSSGGSNPYIYIIQPCHFEFNHQRRAWSAPEMPRNHPRSDHYRQPLDFAMRPIRGEDIPAVMDVETATYPHPWTEGIFRDCLRVGYCCRVLMASEEIVGYGVMAVAVGECHTLNVCVHPQVQRQGFEHRIPRRLLAGSRSRNADTAFLEVRASKPTMPRRQRTPASTAPSIWT